MRGFESSPVADDPSDVPPEPDPKLGTAGT